MTVNRFRLCPYNMPELPMFESLSDTTADPAIRGFLHRPQTSNGNGLVYTHGAGGNAQGAFLVALANAFADAGFTALRIDLPYRQRRSFGPPGPADAARDRAGLNNAVATMRKLVSGRVFLGGHSYGGRQASMLCAEEPELVNGLLLSSYPLHPPGKPTQLRIEHLHKLKVPTLFVEGTRDAFASVDQIKSAMRLIPAKTELMIVEGGGHDLGVKAKSKPDELAKLVVEKFQQFLS
jgi:uncharacterized protein